MVFNSVGFLLYFLPIFLILYGLAPKKYRNVALLAGSLIFYACGEVRHLCLLLASMAANYEVGLYLSGNRKESKKEKRARTLLLIAAVAGNVGLLGLFKALSGILGLPLGISFYTFRILSYLIDVYRGEIHREWSFVRLANYICMFPQMISGPISTYGEVAPGLEAAQCTAEGIQDGLKLFAVGLAAKVLLADRVGLLWNEVTTTGYESISTPLAWLAAVAYSMKIYFDFYGYSLMAMGLGRMIGVGLPENFREPYLARGVRDFYRRWHVTLGRWFRNYVYIPLGGNRKGEGRTVLNLLVVWILTSIWHGVTVNFLLWGLLLWACIVLERLLERFAVVRKMRILPRLYLWFIIPVSWVCFGITDLPQLGIYLGRLFGLSQGINVYPMDWQEALATYGGRLAACFVACTPFLKWLYRKGKDTLPGLVALGALFWYCVWRIIVEGGNTFLYANF